MRRIEEEASVLPASWAESRQLLIVAPADHGPPWSASLCAARRDGRWRRVMGPLEAVIGRGGFAMPGEKREGDGKTPSGVFALEHAFGYAPEIPTAMAYRQVGRDDVWVDDPGSADYNRWTARGRTEARSFEVLKRPDNLYRYGIVIGYNRDPVVKGRGSAIFLHVRQQGGVATSGCVALDENDIVALLAWLDPSLAPLCVMGDTAARLCKRLSLP